jgi:hypothetical protein
MPRLPLYKVAGFLAVTATLALAVSACQVDTKTGKGAATIVGRGIVNDPKNTSLRFGMIEFGLHEFCHQLLSTGAPMRLDDDQPVIGRFFADSCQAKSIDDTAHNTIMAQFGGRGYAWTLGTGRLGFRARGLLELKPDFRVYDGAMYVYFRPAKVDTSDFEVLMTERKLAEAAATTLGLDEKELGRAIIDAQLGRGFTAVRYDADGHTDFAIGLIARGDTPFRPFEVVSSPRETIANGRTELFLDQQDYLGRVHVAAGQALSLTLELDGTNELDVAIVPALGGLPVQRYVENSGPQRPSEAPPFRALLSRGAPLRAEVPLTPGDYYVVFDHSGAFGSVSPGPKELPARVDYLVQLGAAGTR